MGYTKAQVQDFIQNIAPLIKTEAEKRGYHSCAAVIAQAIIESAAGTSKLASGYHPQRMQKEIRYRYSNKHGWRSLAPPLG